MSNVASYIAGQCTAYVASVFSWVPAGWGNAYQWFTHAKEEAYQTGMAPMTGAIAVWGPGLPGSDGNGHVAAVQSVSKDGSFTVSEMNYSCGPGCKDTRTVAPGGGSDFLGFIYPKSGDAQAMGFSADTSTGGSNCAEVSGVFVWQTPSLNLFGQSIGAQCIQMDGIIAAGAIGGGILFVGLALLVLAATVLKRPIREVASIYPATRTLSKAFK